jgi:hypothetical protein
LFAATLDTLQLASVDVGNGLGFYRALVRGFVEEESLNHLVPLATLAIGVLAPMEALLEAYRSGGGVPYEAYGADTREGIAATNRPMFVNQLAGLLGSIRRLTRAGARSDRPASRISRAALRGQASPSRAPTRRPPEVV